jgi:hypothetical protein
MNEQISCDRIHLLALQIQRGFEEIDDFIQKATEVVCPRCKDVCCISKHGFYAPEDLFYLHALGMEAPQRDATLHESDPCPFLAPDGCSMKRWMRPSGCNWYLCESLFDQMECMEGYRRFDEKMKEIAELWLQMTEAHNGLSYR